MVGFALAYVPVRTYFPINMGGEPPEGCIKVVSYNVCAFGGNYKYDDAVDTVADYLKRLDADIVCLQEDMGGKGGNGFEKMKELYPYNDTVHVSTSPLVINAVGIHTRYPIIRKERIVYDSSTNGSVAYFLQVGTDTVLVINNHLESTHLSDDMRQRYKEVLKGEMEQEEAEAQMHSIFGKLSESMGKRGPQAEAVSHYVETYSQYPIILCGDFNDTPESTEEYSRIMLNLAGPLASKGMGTIKYSGKWEMIDMFFISPSLVKRNPGVRMKIEKIPFLMVRDNAHSGEKPFRTFSGPTYSGGVSDHCPITLVIR